MGDDLTDMGISATAAAAMGREQVARASPGAPACGKHGCHDRPEAEPRPCGVPRPPRGMPPGRPRWPPASLVRDRGLRSPALCWWALSGGLLPGFHGVERGTGKTPGRTDPLEAVGQTRAGRGGGTHRRDLRRPKGPDVSVLASSSSTCMINSPIRFMAMSSSAFTGSPLRSLSEASIPAIAFSRHARAGKSPRPTAATKVPPARHAKAAGQPHACASPSTAGQVPAGLPAKPGPGKTWTSQARPRLPQAHQQQLCSQNCRSCSGPPWTLRLSQFCVQGNRVRLTLCHTFYDYDDGNDPGHYMPDPQWVRRITADYGRVHRRLVSFASGPHADIAKTAKRWLQDLDRDMAR